MTSAPLSLFSAKAWVLTARPKTLLLSSAGVILGSSAVALGQGIRRPGILLLTLLTSALLQMLSNFCNDYGDWSKGTDAERIGPRRAIHLGLVDKRQLFVMIIVLVILCVISGLSLLFLALGSDRLIELMFFLLLGAGAIVAAAKYTLGKNPYGYSGWGDLSVFMFFGLINVAGAGYLQTLAFDPVLIIPALCMGCLSACVLNLNNIRDEASDRIHGKHTLVVRWGRRSAKTYQSLLVVVAMFCVTVHFFWFMSKDFRLLALPLILWLLVRQVIQLAKAESAEQLNSLLGWVSKSAFVSAVVWSGACLLP